MKWTHLAEPKYYGNRDCQASKGFDKHVPTTRKVVGTHKLHATSSDSQIPASLNLGANTRKWLASPSWVCESTCTQVYGRSHANLLHIG